MTAPAPPLFELCGDCWPPLAHVDYDPVMEPIDTSAILEVRGLVRKASGRDVLRGVDLTLRSGQRLGVLGANGSGKTTLVRTLAGLLRAHGGTIRISGYRPGSAGAGARIGWMPERPALPDQPVLQLLRTGCALTGTPADRADAILDELDLSALAPHRGPRLSQGQQRLVTLALALVHDPALLLLDEPLTALDTTSSQALRRALDRRPDTAVLATAHTESDLTGVVRSTRTLRDGVLSADAP